jgi:hypothetical protein
MRNMLIAVSAIVWLQACATPYRPPTEPPPPEWTGPSGWDVDPGSQKIHEGPRGNGDVLIEYVLKPRRTGTVVEAVQTKSAYGKDIIIPKGTRVFAENFTLVTQTGWAGQKQVEQVIDPIEWCAVLPRGIDGKQAGSQGICLFWESPAQARYMEDYTIGGFGYAPAVYGTTGMPGPVPQIDATAVDLGVEVRSQLRIVRLDDKRIEIQEILTDGSAQKQQGRERPVYWRGQRTLSFEYAGAKFEVVASDDYGSVQFKRVATAE